MCCGNHQKLTRTHQKNTEHLYILDDIKTGLFLNQTTVNKPPERFELSTFGLQDQRSAAEL